MLYKNVLIEARVQELKEQLIEITKRKARKWKRIQHGGILEYSIAALYIATKVSIAPQPSKRLIVVVVKKKPNQLNSTIEIVERLAITLIYVKTIKKKLLNLIQVY